MAELTRKYSEFRDKLSRRKTAEKRKAHDQDFDKRGCKNLQSFEIKDSKQSKEDKMVNFSQLTGVGKSTASPKMALKSNMDELFSFGNYEFKELGDGKVRCGVCQVECIRLVFHLNGNVKCAEKFYMPDFKIEYSRYKNNQRLKKNRAKKKGEDPEGFKDDARKHLEKCRSKKKIENPQGFKNDADKSRKKYSMRKTAEDPEGFKNDADKRRKKFT